jgi:hypothetical protein
VRKTKSRGSVEWFDCEGNSLLHQASKN